MSKEISLHFDKDYLLFIDRVKDRLKNAQIRAAHRVNLEVIIFYWRLGKDILDAQSSKKHWGKNFLVHLSKDLQTAHEGMSGFSKRNLEYMRLFATLYKDENELKQPDAQLPWSHIQLLLDKFKDNPVRRSWYAIETLKYGWSRATLNTHIKSNLYERQGIEANKVSNYKTLLPSPQSDLAQEMLKSPYNFDFLTVSKSARERDIEKGLITHIKDFLMELGAGFSLVGTQVPLEIDGEEYFLDLLFYHLKLRCFIVGEIKAKKFKPADVGQLNFYLAAVDAKFRHPQDNPSIGILLCESRSKIIAEYALRNINSPIGVSEYTLSKALPAELIESLPTVEQIEAELNISTDEK